MQRPNVHSFHIPVLGLAFSIDTPLKVARYGISSVVSIVDDILIEQMRKQHSLARGESYSPITTKEEDFRARRITEYLNLLHRTVQEQFASLKASAFEKKSEIVRYFELLADHSPLKALYHKMMQTEDAGEKATLQERLREAIVPGEIDVNIMTKVDRVPPSRSGQPVAPDSSDALSSLRGFARSTLTSSVVLSAGLNQRLFGYMAQLAEFLPDREGKFRKKVTLKVSDYRSAYIQGKILARKGIWVSEYRIESGLNCGGHAFVSEGDVLGPILEEFKKRKEDLIQELFGLYTVALEEKKTDPPSAPPEIRITVQGGIGTANEDAFLREFYQVDGTGWGSPFLLVPEATNVDEDTRQMLARARKEDFYISDASPLGIPFNNLRNSSSEQQIRRRIDAGKPGSPCTKKFLCSNTEFTKEPICTASSQYQRLKIRQWKEQNLPEEQLDQAIRKLQEKSCLCEDLAAPALINSGMNGAIDAVAVCPGPNLAYFSKIASLEEMVGHIYGRFQLLTDPERPNMFVNELRLNIDYLKKEIQERWGTVKERERKRLETYGKNLQEGIEYYRTIIPNLVHESEVYRERMRQQLAELEAELMEMIEPKVLVPVEA